MKPTKRYTDPLGRSALVSRYRLHALCLALAILGSAWPIWPRSIRAAFDKKRGSAKAEREARSQSGHGPREQTELPVTERQHLLDQADHICPSCGGRLEEMAGQSEDSEEVDVLERQFVLVQHKRKSTAAPAAAASRPRLGPTSSSPVAATRSTSP